MRFISVCVMLLVMASANALAVFSTASGCSSVELYHSTAKIAALALDNGNLYFGRNSEIKALNLSDNQVVTAGTLGNNMGVSFVTRVNGTTYTAFGTSLNSPYPYSMGYINGQGAFEQQFTMSGGYDVAFNSKGECYLVADGISAKIYKYDLVAGVVIQVGDMGSYQGSIAFDAQDNLYYAHQGGQGILKFTASQVAAGSFTATDGQQALNITAGYIAFDQDQNLYATTGWGALFASYDLNTKSKIYDVAYGDVGNFVLAGDTIYAIDSPWSGLSTLNQITIPEPVTMLLFGLGGLAIARKKKA